MLKDNRNMEYLNYGSMQESFCIIYRNNLDIADKVVSKIKKITVDVEGENRFLQIIDTDDVQHNFVNVDYSTNCKEIEYKCSSYEYERRLLRETPSDRIGGTARRR